ncbi:MAG: hypothetical protein AB8G18_01340 [Gammaproteobacteria bacterium]
MTLFRRLLVTFALAALCSGCIGTMVGQTTNAAVEVVKATSKVTTKAGGAVIDVATRDDEKD